MKGWFDKTLWDLYGNYHDQKNAPTKAENVLGDIDKYLTNNKPGFYSEYDLIKKYRDNIDQSFQWLKLLGSDQLGEFFYHKDIALPVHFFNYGLDTSLALIISTAFIDKIYNTIKLTSRQRATKVVTTYLLPAIQQVAKNFKDGEVKYFGFTAVYGSKNALDNSVLALQAEFVGIVIPAQLINKYATGDITEDELLQGADVFSSDRDMVAEVKKIKITVE